jgi:hypothetical protein
LASPQITSQRCRSLEFRNKTAGIRQPRARALTPLDLPNQYQYQPVPGWSVRRTS